MTQRLPPSLTPLDAALAALLKGLDPLAPLYGAAALATLLPASPSP